MILFNIAREHLHLNSFDFKVYAELNTGTCITNVLANMYKICSGLNVAPRYLTYVQLSFNYLQVFSPPSFFCLE